MSLNVVPPPTGTVYVNPSGNPVQPGSHNNQNLSDLVKMMGGQKKNSKSKSKSKSKKGQKKSRKMLMISSPILSRSSLFPSSSFSSLFSFPSFSSSMTSADATAPAPFPKYSSSSSSFVSSSVFEKQNNKKPFEESNIRFASSENNDQGQMNQTSWSLHGKKLSPLMKKHEKKYQQWYGRMHNNAFPRPPQISFFSSPLLSWSRKLTKEEGKRKKRPRRQTKKMRGGNIQVATVPVPYQQTTGTGSSLNDITANLAGTINQNHANAQFDQVKST